MKLKSSYMHTVLPSIAGRVLPTCAADWQKGNFKQGRSGVRGHGFLFLLLLSEDTCVRIIKPFIVF